MLTQGAKASVSRKMILEIMSKHPEDFAQFKTEHDEILKSVLMYDSQTFLFICTSKVVL